jgi:hypothetical protein
MSLTGLVVTSRRNDPPDLPSGSAYRLEPGRPTPGWPTLLRLPFADNASSVVQEY